MFERFTDRARNVLVVAQEESRFLCHDYIGTEHILLGVLGVEEGLAAQALGALGVTLGTAREKVVERVGPGNEASRASPPFTTRAKKVLELSLSESLRLHHNYIGTEHILLALVREGDGVGPHVLKDMVGELSQVDEKVFQLLGQTSHDRPRSNVRTSTKLSARAWLTEGTTGRPPYCHSCGSGLEGKLAYSRLSATGPSSSDPVIGWTFAFCQSCGVMVGTALSSEVTGEAPTSGGTGGGTVGES